MIDLKDLNRAVCDLYRQALKTAGNAAEILPELVAEDVPSPIVRPSAKVELEPGTQARLLHSGQEKTATFRLYFFAADRYRPKMENLAVRQAVESLTDSWLMRLYTPLNIRKANSLY